MKELLFDRCYLNYFNTPFNQQVNQFIVQGINIRLL